MTGRDVFRRENARKFEVEIVFKGGFSRFFECDHFKVITTGTHRTFEYTNIYPQILEMKVEEVVGVFCREK